jgi:hypothetical protein
MSVTVLHARGSALPLGPEVAVGVLALGVAVVAVVAYDAYRRWRASGEGESA